MPATFWNLDEIAHLMAARGITTQQGLNTAAGLSRLTMHNIARAGPLTRIDVPTVDGLAKALGLKGEDRWRLFSVED